MGVGYEGEYEGEWVYLKWLVSLVKAEGKLRSFEIKSMPWSNMFSLPFCCSPVSRLPRSKAKQSKRRLHMYEKATMTYACAEKNIVECWKGKKIHGSRAAPSPQLPFWRKLLWCSLPHLCKSRFGAKNSRAEFPDLERKRPKTDLACFRQRRRGIF